MATVYGNTTEFLGYFGGNILSRPWLTTLNQYLSSPITKEGGVLANYLIQNGVNANSNFSQIVGNEIWFNVLDRSLKILTEIQESASDIKITNEYGTGLGQVFGASEGKIFSEPSFTVKKTAVIQLDSPTPNPIIGPGESHTYEINLGQYYSKIALTNFQWIESSLIDDGIDTVIANVSLRANTFNGILLVGQGAGNWVRNFDINSPEFQNGSSNPINAVFGSTIKETSVPLGYGTDPLQVPLDHTSLQTNPVKKLQIEDIYLNGNNLIVVIKNYDSTPINLSPYIGLTALFDDGRLSVAGAVSQNGTIVYLPEANTSLRITEDLGSTFRTIPLPKNEPDQSEALSRQISSLSLYSDGATTFMAMINYLYVLTAQSPSYEVKQVFHIESKLNPNFSVDGNQSPIEHKKIDWVKNSSESCMLFTGFWEYNYSPVGFKSVDDGKSFGNNPPNFNNNQPIFNAGNGIHGLPFTTDVPDFKAVGSGKYAKVEPTVIDSNTHYMSLSYVAQPELLYDGLLVPKNQIERLYVGPRTISGPNGIQFEIRENEIVTTATSNIWFDQTNFIPGLPNDTRLVISGSSSGNTVQTTKYELTIGEFSIYYVGAQEVDGVTLLKNEVAILKTDYETVTDGKTIVIGDIIQANPQLGGSPPPFNRYTLTGVRFEEIDAVEYAILSLSNIAKIAQIPYPEPAGVFVTEPTFDVRDGGGSPIIDFGTYFTITPIITYRILGGLGFNDFTTRTYFIIPTNYNFEPEFNVNQAEGSNSNLKFGLRRGQDVQKSLLLKTVDGGQNWESINEDPEFRFAPANIFYSSPDGQNLLLATMRYPGTLGFESWSYSTTGTTMGMDVRFNQSNDGGQSWVYSSGNWTEICRNGLNPANAQKATSQILGKVDDTILAYITNFKNIPTLVRSIDNGQTFSEPIVLPIADPNSINNSYSVKHNDSKGNFSAIFGYLYQSTGTSSSTSNILYYGGLITNFTEWKVVGQSGN
jgi:hypothetical protein